MKSLIAGIVLSSLAATAFAADSLPTVIPKPKTMSVSAGTYTLTADTKIIADGPSRQTAEHLAAQLRNSTGYPFEIAASGNGITLTTQGAKANLGPEGYELQATPGSVVIRAPEQAGLFYGVQTLLQLLPPEIYAQQKVTNEVAWSLPAVQIEDQPRFKWRGFMLDVSRHFYDKEEVKRMLDTMAHQKLNTFHWHLVDDHGWRIEIKKYPKLTEVAAWRSGIGFNLDPKSSRHYDAQGRYGGFYTQDDIREVIAYAKSRHITIVPEIEMPGHSTSLLVAYPELGCTGGPYALEMKGGIFHGVLCAGKDETFTFLEDVLAEVFALFPGKYVHIGGDEVPKDNWQKCPRCQARIKAEKLKNEHELQSYFIRRVEKFFTAQKRSLIGWSEIAEGGLAPSAAIMDWIGGGLEAATNGHDVVMSPTRFCYLDYYQSTNQSREPRAIGNYLPLNRVYAFEPVPAALPEQFHQHILGVQGNLWTEYIAALPHVQYMVFPRLTAIAEVGWTQKASRDWYDFNRRLQDQYQRFDQLGIQYRHHPYNLPADTSVAPPRRGH